MRKLLCAAVAAVGLTLGAGASSADAGWTYKNVSRWDPACCRYVTVAQRVWVPACPVPAAPVVTVAPAVAMAPAVPVAPVVTPAPVVAAAPVVTVASPVYVRYGHHRHHTHFVPGPGACVP